MVSGVEERGRSGRKVEGEAWSSQADVHADLVFSGTDMMRWQESEIGGQGRASRVSGAPAGVGVTVGQ